MSGSSKQTTDGTQNSQTSPWAPQAGALSSAFSNAQTAYGTASQAVAPTNFVAQFNPDQLATFKSMLGYGNTNGIAGANQATGNTMADAGTNGATGALSGLMGFNPTDPTQANIADATAYANNPAISGMVQGAMRDANQQAHDLTLPGMESAAAGSGNINSSRTGVAEGIVQRGLAQQAGDLSAQLRGQEYDNGLNLASSNNQFDTTAKLNALGTAGSLGGTLANSGVAARSGALTDATNSYALSGAGGAGAQAADQANLDNQEQQFQSQTSAPYAALQNLMSIIGSNNWGSSSTGSSTSTQTSTPSAWSVIGGLLGAGGSLAGGLGKMGVTMSDRRVKEDIKRVGTLDNGLPVYTFRYRGQAAFHMGLMAQDVEQVKPEAVHELVGIKHVDYEMAAA